MQAIARYLDEAGARGGLTESEIAVLGIIYAANATLFPTSALDVIPGAGKAVSKSGELIKAGIKAEDAAKVAAAETKADLFEKQLASIPSKGEKVAAIKQASREVADLNGWVKDGRLTRLNGRDVYKTSDGSVYSLDTQHGRWEKINPKTGAHEGEFKLIDQRPIPNSVDRSGQHDLKVK